MNCLVCQKPLTGRSKKYCGNTCKQRAKNDSRHGSDTVTPLSVSKSVKDTIKSVKSDTVQSKSDTVRKGSDTLSDTDKSFNDYRPGYYRFTEASYAKDCLICGKKFTTSLTMLKACSPQHYEDLVGHLSGQPAKEVIIKPPPLKIVLTPGKNPSHAKLVSEDSPGAIKYKIKGETVWVTPGQHWIGRDDPKYLPRIWSECLNPNCSTELTT